MRSKERAESLGSGIGGLWFAWYPVKVYLGTPSHRTSVWVWWDWVKITDVYTSSVGDTSWSYELVEGKGEDAE